MDVGELFQVLIFAALLLWGLLSGNRKKAQQRQRAQLQARRASQQAESPSQPDEVDPVRPIPPRAREPVSLAEELLDLLQAQQVQVPSGAGAPDLIETEDEAEPLERSESAGEARHREFHERYIEPVAASESPPPTPPVRRRVMLTPKTARQAIVLMEILGEPKGLTR